MLVGTISVEVSEKLSNDLRKNGVKHVVLNAKPEHAQREGETIAEAGRPGAVTIATNMAGRGVDIMLGGNAEHLTRMELRKLGLEPGDEGWDETYEQVYPKIKAEIDADHEQVKELGGLFILGTERHESRRIDNQLRGRAGRQGDPGESRFFLSAEDDLVRLFAGRPHLPDPRPARARWTTRAASSRSRPRCSRARSRTRRRRSRSRTS